MKLRNFLTGLLLTFSFSIAASDYKQLVSDAEATESIKIFAKQMASKHQFDEKELFNTLSSLKHNQDIIKKITKPAESVMPWFKYRDIWMKDKRINEGVQFWHKHADTLARAKKIYGVDPAIIVGIIGVETFYGKIQGTYSVLEALHTLGFYYPKRAEFFRNELAQYLLLARNQEWQLEQVKGSYAGAMGMGQFISSSYRHYAVDFNADGKVNLFTDPIDMIGSVANYFSRHHWRKDGFVIKPVKVKSAQLKLIQSELKQSNTVETMKSNGVDVSDLINKTDTAAIYAFDKNEHEKEYWLGGENFYVITRYNHSEMYALAVFQLSEAIKAEVKKRF